MLFTGQIRYLAVAALYAAFSTGAWRGPAAQAAEPEALPAGSQPAAAVATVDGSLPQSASMSLEQQRQMTEQAIAAHPSDPLALSARAQFYLRAGNESLAEADLRAALEITPNDYLVWASLARCLEAQGRPAEALDAYDQAISLHADDPALLLARGSLRLQQTNDAGADSDFGAALMLAADEPGSAPVLSAIGLAYSRAGRYESASAYLQHAYAADSNPAYLTDLAEGALNCNALSDAEAALNAVASAAPGDPRVALLLGRLSMLRGEPALAVQHCAAAAGTGGGWEAQLALARALDSARDSEALAAWDKLASGFATERPALLAYGWAMLARGDLIRAGTGFDSALRLVPEDEEPLRGQAAILLAKGDNGQGLALLWQAADLNPQPQVYIDILNAAAADPALAADARRAQDELAMRFPQHPAALRANAQRLYEAGSYEAAQQACARALDSAPGDPMLLRLLGDCQSRRGQYSAAAQSYQSALSLQYDAGCVASLAAAVSSAGDSAGSAGIWQQYIMQHPNDAALHRGRADGLYRDGLFEQALGDYEEARRLAPADADLANQTGLCLLQLDRSQDALRHFQDAQAISPDPLYQENIAYTLGLLGDWPGAEKAWRNGLSEYPRNPALLAGLADALAAQGQGSDGQAALRAAAAESKDPALYLHLAEIALEMGDSQGAENAYRDGLAIAPADYPLLSGLCLLLARAGRIDPLFDYTQSARHNLSPSDYNNLLDAVSSQWLDSGGSPAAAIGYFERLIAADPREPAAYCQLAIQLANSGDFPGALSSVRRGLNDAGDFYLAHYLECYLTYAVSGGGEALPLARALVQHSGAEAKGWLLLLRLLQEQGNYSEQAEQAEAGLQKNPGNGEILAYLARASYYGGDPAGAAAVLEDPARSELKFAGRDALLGSCYLDLGNYPKAAAYLSNAAQQPGATPDLLASLAESLYHLGRLDEARAALDTVLAESPSLPQALLWLGFIQVASGELPAAEASLSTVEKSPLSGREELAWAALARARLALAQGDKNTAGTFLNASLGYGYNTDAFYAEYDEIEAQVQQ